MSCGTVILQKSKQKPVASGRCIADSKMQQRDKCTLVVFCKRPALGQGKQRLAQSIGAGQALQVARCLLECTLEDMQQWQQHSAGPLVISPASRDDAEWAQSLCPDAVVVPQPDGNLGERLNQVDGWLRSKGHQRLIFIGTDAPLLDINDLLTAKKLLESNDVVLQPAADGGVTLMSAASAWPELAALPWSTSGLQQALCAACLVDGCSVWLLPGSIDTDYWQELYGLLPQLQMDSRPARQNLAECIAGVSF